VYYTNRRILLINDVSDTQNPRYTTSHLWSDPVGARQLRATALIAARHGPVVRPLWRAAAPGLKPLRLPRAQLHASFSKRATNYRDFLRQRPIKIRYCMGVRHPVESAIPNHMSGPLCNNKNLSLSLSL